MPVEVQFSGLTGLLILAHLAGMLYFGFVLMRVRKGPWERVFFWAAVCQAGGVLLVAAVVGVSRMFSYGMVGSGGVDWFWVARNLSQGLMLAGALAGGIALVVCAWRKA